MASNIASASIASTRPSQLTSRSGVHPLAPRSPICPIAWRRSMTSWVLMCPLQSASPLTAVAVRVAVEVASSVGVGVGPPGDCAGVFVGAGGGERIGEAVGLGVGVGGGVGVGVGRGV